MSTNSNQRFGHRLRISKTGNRVIIGAKHSTTGFVEVFEYSSSLTTNVTPGGTWTRVHNTKLSTNNNGRWGGRIAINGDGSMVAIANNHSTGEQGVWVYMDTGSAWYRFPFFAGGAAAVCMNRSGTRVAIHRSDGNMNYVKIYDYDSPGQTTGTWTLIGRLYGNHDADYFGWAMDMNIDGNIISVGAGSFDAWGLKMKEKSVVFNIKHYHKPNGNLVISLIIQIIRLTLHLVLANIM